jgi:iron complex outermembrane receptor protein
VPTTTWSFPRRAATAALVLVCAGGAGAQDQDTPDLTTMSLDQLLEAEVVYAASRRIQTLREAPSAVSVVTAAEIRAHGYRTVADVLRSLPSFYVTEDRRYSFVGVRGFSRPGDYGARILLLLNGLRTNDSLYEQAYVGQDFIVDIDLVERIEVVRGPSAAIYGSSAFFAVVNVVTRRGRDFQGGELSLGASSFDTRSGRASYGRRLDNGLEVLLSASLSGSGGQRLYFKEYDDPGTANGVADRIDGENFDRVLASLSKGDFTFEANHVSRDKGIPTGVYGTVFGDARTRTTDAKDLVSLTYAHSRPNRSSVMARVHYGRLAAHGTYAITDAPTGVTEDSGRGEWYGLEGSLVRPLGARHLLTAGVEFQDDFSLRQLNFDPVPRVIHQDSRNESKRAAVFGQDEITLSKRLTFHVGVRQDWYQGLGHQTSPRLALVFDVGGATTLKLLAGRAFRAPDEFELHFAAPPYKTNPRLGPETIHTTELVLEKALPHGLHLNASTYLNEVHDLISLRLDPADGRLVYENLGRGDSVGAEIGLDFKRGGGSSGHLSYAWQRSREQPSGELLTNSPRHMLKAGMAWPLLGKRLTAGVDGWYLSSRTTLSGAQAGSAKIANFTLAAPRILGRFDLSASVYNLFDARYADPGAPEHRQDLIIQDGRSGRLKVGVRF